MLTRTSQLVSRCITAPQPSHVRRSLFSTAASSKELPSSADVVVIGGGAVGNSTLYHLAALGVDAVLLEKDQLTAGTTWHSAGLLWRLRPNDTEIELINRTRELVKTDGILSTETGQTCGWQANGGLFVASSTERMQEYQRLHTLGKYFGIDSALLSPAETTDLYPLMNVSDGVHGTLYSPGDGTVEPAEYVTTLSKAAKLKGARIFENTPVAAIDTTTSASGQRSVRGVITADGRHIAANQVIICGGVWSRDFGAANGVRIPLCAMKHAFVLTDAIPNVRGLPNVRDHDLSLYLRVQGESLQVGGYESRPCFWDAVEPEFAFSLFELDWDAFAVHLEHATQRVPIIERIGLKSEVCGPESFTADHKPLLGPLPEFADGSLFVGAGFNSAGIMLSGGCGEQLAQWMVRGHPSLDMFGYDVRRFHPQMTDDDAWIRQRSHEAYAKNYSIVFPMDEPLASRNMRCSPIHDALLDAGCVFQERHGFERPAWFDTNAAALGTNNECKEYDYYGEYGFEAHADYPYRDRLDAEYTFGFADNHEAIGAEVWACRNRVAVFDQSYFGKFFVRGPDALAAMQYICTNDIERPVGSTVYTQMCNHNGRVECDLAVSRIAEDEFYITAGGGSHTRDWAHIERIVQEKGFDCTMLNRSGDFAMLSVMGPMSRDLLYACSAREDSLSNENFPFATTKEIELLGSDGALHSLRAIRLTFVGELGWELHIPRDSAAAVYASLMEKGRAFDAVNAGYRAIDSLSCEKGYLHWHEDVGLFDTPLEAGVGFVVPKKKLESAMDFRGKDALMAQKAQGLRKRLVYVSLRDADREVRLHGLETIWRNGVDCVGFLRRASFDYTRNVSIGTGYVVHHARDGGKVTPKYIRGETEEDEDGVFYELEVMGQRYPCDVSVKAQFDPKNERIKGNYDAAMLAAAHT